MFDITHNYYIQIFMFFYDHRNAFQVVTNTREHRNKQISNQSVSSFKNSYCVK